MREAGCMSNVRRGQDFVTVSQIWSRIEIRKISNRRLDLFSPVFAFSYFVIRIVVCRERWLYNVITRLSIVIVNQM